MVDCQALEWERHHPDAALLEHGPARFTAALRRILDCRDRQSAVMGIEQHRDQVEPLELIQFQLDRASRSAQKVHDCGKRARPIG